jgi:hypothetical protein
MCTEIDVEHAAAHVRGRARASSRLRAARTLEAEAGPSRAQEVGQGTSDEFETESSTDSSGSFRGVKCRHSDSDTSDSTSRKAKRPNKGKFSWRRCK